MVDDVDRHRLATQHDREQPTISLEEKFCRLWRGCTVRANLRDVSPRELKYDVNSRIVINNVTN
jgi:hypothetical protein